MFWAILFITVGVILLIQQVLGIHLPIFKLCFGVFLVYMGLKVIFGAFGMNFRVWDAKKMSTDTEAIFSESEFKIKSDGSGRANSNFTTVFGKSTLDTTQFSKEELSQPIKVDNVFGHTLILTDPSIPLKVQANVAFGHIQVRDQKFSFIGDNLMTTPGFEETKPHLFIQVSSVFGEVSIK